MTTLADTVEEDDETFNFVISNPTGGGGPDAHPGQRIRVHHDHQRRDHRAVHRPVGAAQFHLRGPPRHAGVARPGGPPRTWRARDRDRPAQRRPALPMGHGGHPQFLGDGVRPRRLQRDHQEDGDHPRQLAQRERRIVRHDRGQPRAGRRQDHRRGRQRRRHLQHQPGHHHDRG